MGCLKERAQLFALAGLGLQLSEQCQSNRHADAPFSVLPSQLLIHPDHVAQGDAVLLDPVRVAAGGAEEVAFDPPEAEAGLLCSILQKRKPAFW
jgi:hypothetical protein